MKNLLKLLLVSVICSITLYADNGIKSNDITTLEYYFEWVDEEIVEDTDARGLRVLKKKPRKKRFSTVLRTKAKQKKKMPSRAKRHIKKDRGKTSRAIARGLKTVDGVEIVYATTARSLKEDYYICSYENTTLNCLSTPIEIAPSDVENVLPKTITDFLYTKAEIEAIEDFYIIH